MIIQNLSLVQERIGNSAKRAGRDPSKIRLIAVTKQANLAQIKDAVLAGVAHVGENRIGDALLKYNALGKLAKSIKWHMIGHLQTNKVKKCLQIFDTIHSLDSISLAKEVDKQAKCQGKRIDCFVEVNVSSEASKYGISYGSAGDFIEQVSGFTSIRIIGLMTMAPIVKDPEDARPYFKKLCLLRDNLNQSCPEYLDIKELSMGMTQDFEVAIEEGATFIRVGTAIFQ
jgi:PLP dependent protein